MFQWRVLIGDYTGGLGLALAHPLYIAGGRALMAISEQHLPWLLNCLSGLGMAVALANLAALVSLLTGRRWIGLATAAMLAVTHTAWWLSTIAEVYTWSVAGLTCEIWLLAALVRRPRWQTLAALAFVSGVGLCVHNFALLPLPVYLAAAAWLILRRKLPAEALAPAAVAYLAGAALYVGMTARLAAENYDVIGAIRSALVGEYGQQVANVAGASKHLLVNAGLSAMNFVNLLLPLAVVGWFGLRRRVGGLLAASLAGVTLIHVVFFVRYPVPDQFTFILPTLVMIALAAGLGLADLADRSRRWRLAAVAACLIAVAAQPVFFAAAPTLARWSGAPLQRRRTLPFRDEGRYWLVPWKHNECSAQRFAEAALAQAAPHGLIAVDSTAVHALLLLRQGNPDWRSVTIQYHSWPLPLDREPAVIQGLLAGRPLYAISDEMLPGRPKLVKDDESQVLYRVSWDGPPSRPAEAPDEARQSP